MSITIGAIIGDRVRITGTFFSLDDPLVPADPTTVEFLHRLPDGSEVVYTFGTDAEIIKDSTGVYHADLLVQTPYTHYFRTNGLGAIAQSYETFVVVPESAFDFPLPSSFTPPPPSTGTTSVVVIIQAESDFPTAVGNIITLADEAVYQVEGTVTLTAGVKILAGTNTVIRGLGRERDLLVGDVADALVTIPTAAGSFTVRDMSMQQINIAGDGLAAVDATLSRFLCADFQLTVAGGDAILVGAASFSMREARLLGFGRGVVLGAGGSTMIIDGALMSQADGTGGNGCIDLGSNQWSAVVRVSNVSMVAAVNGFSFKGLAGNGNMANSFARGNINRSRLVGPGGELDAVTVDDLQWQMENNSGIADSYAIGDYGMTDNTVTQTVIPSLLTFVKIAGTTTSGVNPAPRRMSMTDNNEMTIEELDLASYTVNVTVTASKSGGSLPYGFAVFVNGSQIGRVVRHEVSTTIESTSFSFPAELVAGNTVDVRAEQLSGSVTNILVDSLTVSIHGR